MIIINDVVDQQLEATNKDKSTKFSRELTRFWPTDCSCQILNKTFGKCAREMYFSVNNTTSSNPISARGLRICEAGSMYEDKEIERVKNIKYYKDSAVKFNFIIPETNITIAGKLDIVYQIDDKIIGGEIKSGYGYTFKSQVFNTTTTPGMPVIKHLMQVMMYLYYFKYVDTTMGIDEFYLTYIDRGDCENIQFSIKLTEDDYPIIEIEGINQQFIMKNVNLNNGYLFDQNPKGKRELNKVNKIYNKLKYYEISIKNIFDRFKYIADYVNRKELPPKDYKYIYTPEDIELMFSSGEINETKYEKLKESNGIERDFQCTYCNYLKKCISADKITYKDMVSI